MADLVNVIVACTQSKRSPAPPELRASVLDASDPVGARCKDWIKRLKVAEAPEIPVRDLYSGDHWFVSLSLEQAREGNARTAVWVASAGYGLLQLDDLIKPYDASLRVGDAESVINSSDEAPIWWRALSDRHARPARNGARTIEELVSLDPAAPLVVAASVPYLRAMAVDLRRASQVMQDPACLLLVAAGNLGLPSGLEPWRVSFDARMRSVVGGGMQSLNVRVTRFLLEQSYKSGLTRRVAQAHIDNAASGLDQFQYPKRSGQADDEVKEFIAQQLKRDPKSTKSKLLREFRSLGRACEQRRFGELFATVRDHQNG